MALSETKVWSIYEYNAELSPFTILDGVALPNKMPNNPRDDKASHEGQPLKLIVNIYLNPLRQARCIDLVQVSHPNISFAYLFFPTDYWLLKKYKLTSIRTYYIKASSNP